MKRALLSLALATLPPTIAAAELRPSGSPACGTPEIWGHLTGFTLEQAQRMRCTLPSFRPLLGFKNSDRQ